MNRVYLVDKDDARAGPAIFAGQDEALRLLRLAALNYDNLQHFRMVWRTQVQGGGAQPPTDRRVLQFLADRLARGLLRISGPRRAEPAPVRKGGGTGGAAPPPPKPPVAPRPPATPPLKLRPPPIPAEIAKVAAPLIDAAEQANCLVAAAKDGLPFVEQCAKF